MTVRNGVLVVLALLLAAAPAGPAPAFTLGGWEGGPDNDETGAFSDCTMTASYESGITLGLIISRSFDWGLVLADDTWRLPVGSAEDVTLNIDEQAPVQALAKVVDAHGILIPLDNSGPVIDAIRHGRLLMVMTPSGKLTFRLGGVSDAITQLAACVSDSLEAEQTKEGNSAFSALESKARGRGRNAQTVHGKPSGELRHDPARVGRRHRLHAGRPGRESDAQFRRGVELRQRHHRRACRL